MRVWTRECVYICSCVCISELRYMCERWLSEVC